MNLISHFAAVVFSLFNTVEFLSDVFLLKRLELFISNLPVLGVANFRCNLALLLASYTLQVLLLAELVSHKLPLHRILLFLNLIGSLNLDCLYSGPFILVALLGLWIKAALHRRSALSAAPAAHSSLLFNVCSLLHTIRSHFQRV